MTRSRARIERSDCSEKQSKRNEAGEVALMTIKYMTIKHWLLSSAVAFTCFAAPAALAGTIDNYSPVTSSRLENPEAGNWMLYRRTYDGQGYSPLDQVNTTNIKDLVPVWTFATAWSKVMRRRRSSTMASCSSPRRWDR
jgi:glucose dehydrogenase